jgi:23S rRNA pseudouridine1911/1915/1917 synthase
MINEDVPAALDGQRLDRIVALLGDISRSDAAAAIANGGVSVDGALASSGKIRLVEGQSTAAA